MILRIDLEVIFWKLPKNVFTLFLFVYLFIISLPECDFLDLNDLAYLSNPVNSAPSTVYSTGAGACSVSIRYWAYTCSALIPLKAVYPKRQSLTSTRLILPTFLSALTMHWFQAVSLYPVWYHGDETKSGWNHRVLRQWLNSAGGFSLSSGAMRSSRPRLFYFSFCSLQRAVLPPLMVARLLQ